LKTVNDFVVHFGHQCSYLVVFGLKIRYFEKSQTPIFPIITIEFPFVFNRFTGRSFINLMVESKLQKPKTNLATTSNKISRAPTEKKTENNKTTVKTQTKLGPKTIVKKPNAVSQKASAKPKVIPPFVLEENPERIFTYGTLRKIPEKTFHNHHLIEKLVVTMKHGTTKGKMRHYAKSGERGDFPYLETGTENIQGEVLTFTDWKEALERMDGLEGNGSFYTRRVVEIKLDDKSCTSAWVYFLNPEILEEAGPGDHVASGDWYVETANDPEVEGYVIF